MPCDFTSVLTTLLRILFRNIDDVDKTMDEINEQTENMKQIQQALSEPVSSADYDEVHGLFTSSSQVSNLSFVVSFVLIY